MLLPQEAVRAPARSTSPHASPRRSSGECDLPGLFGPGIRRRTPARGRLLSAGSAGIVEALHQGTAM